MCSGADTVPNLLDILNSKISETSRISKISGNSGTSKPLGYQRYLNKFHWNDGAEGTSRIAPPLNGEEIGFGTVPEKFFNHPVVFIVYYYKLCSDKNCKMKSNSTNIRYWWWHREIFLWALPRNIFALIYETGPLLTSDGFFIERKTILYKCVYEP